MKTRTLICITAFAASLFADVGESQQQKVYAVRTTHPQRRTVAQSLVKTGSFVANAEVSLCSKISGRLAEVGLEGGDVVREGTRAVKGQRLARIDSREWKARRDSAAASVAAAEAELADAGREFDRALSLRSAKAVTESDYDAAVARRDKAAASLAQAKAALAMAEIDLEECDLCAPFDGVVTKVTRHPGAMLSAGDEVFVFAATDPLEARFEVPTSSLPLFRSSTTHVAVAVDAYPEETIELTVSDVFPAADSATRTVTVRAFVDNPDGKYLPGMFATAEFALGERPDVIVVPFEAILKIQGRRCVYKVVGGKAILADVVTGLRHDDIVEIVSGVSEGDEIVVDGLHRLSSGVAVNVVD